MQIALKNDLKEIERLLDVVEEWGGRNDLPAKVTFDLQLALDEIFTNIVSYGYEGGGEHEILVRLAYEGDEVRVQVEDHGRAFNPLERAEPDLDVPLEERTVGGLGIYLVRRLMDSVEYRREAGKNVLSLRRNTRAS